jgi:hypothetical protein
MLTRILLFLLLLVSDVLAFGATRTWTGAALNGKWSDPTNWGGSIPTPGDRLVFPEVVASRSTSNDLPPLTSFDALTIGSNYRLFGNSIALAGGLVFDLPEAASTDTFLPLTIAAPQSWIITGRGPSYATVRNVQLTNPIHLDLGSGTLTLFGSGSGSLDVTSTGQLGGTMSLGGAFTSPIAVSGSASVGIGATANTTAGDIHVTGTAACAESCLPTVNLAGDVKNVTISNATFGGLGGSATSLALNRGSVFFLGAAFGVTVTGPIQLGSAAFSFSPVVVYNRGTVLTVIANRSPTPPFGTFANLPEGAVVAANLKFGPATNIQRFRISYSSGTMKDVTLTALGFATATTLGASPNPAPVGETIVLNATVTSSATVAKTGTVTFLDGDQVIGSAPIIVNATAVATLKINTLSEAIHSITAVYSGDVVFDTSSSRAVPVVVGTPAAIPTLSPIGLVLLSLLLIVCASRYAA